MYFDEFVARALYDPEFGYYTASTHPAGKEGDYVTSPSLSPLFSYALGRLATEFLSRFGDEVCAIVDIGSGDGSLLRQLRRELPTADAERTVLIAIDRRTAGSTADGDVRMEPSLNAIPRHQPLLIMSNELFDAFPFARLVRREEGLRELMVSSDADGVLQWSEAPARSRYVEYLSDRTVELQVGQFADVSLEWGSFYRSICERVDHGLLVTFDYGFAQERLFDPRARRFGTAAAYRNQRGHRDLLRDPGEQDLTAHVNFSDLITAGEQAGFQTILWTRQARFLLSLGAAEHPSVATPIQSAAGADPVAAFDARDEARRLLLPDGIGQDIRVLVQEKSAGSGEWSFVRNEREKFSR